MKSWCILLILTLISAILAGCGGQAAPVSETGTTNRSDVLDTSYEDALDASAQLALGTLMLEETERAITPEQATALLPLWQALQGGVTAEGEINAVLRGIEGAMTEEQLATIAGMQLNQEDMQAWMEERGPGMGGGFPGEGDISEEEREAVRATRQAEFGGEGMSPGGEMPPEMATLRAQFENMSEEERQAMMATARAGGGIGDGFRGGAGGPTGTTAGGLGQARLLLRPLIGLLSERAGGNGS